MISTWNKSYTATRKTAGTTDDDGFYTPGSTTSVPFSGTIMRMSDKERENLPEGQRTTETIKIYTDTDLYVTNITAGTKGDIVTYKGNDYEIVGRSDWDDFNEAGLQHYKLIGQKIDPKEAARKP